MKEEQLDVGDWRIVVSSGENVGTLLRCEGWNFSVIFHRVDLTSDRKSMVFYTKDGEVPVTIPTKNIPVTIQEKIIDECY